VSDDQRRRSMEQYLDTLVDELKALPLTSKRRHDLIRRIRDVEDKIDAESGL